jgi:hypothetical protein
MGCFKILKMNEMESFGIPPVNGIPSRSRSAQTFARCPAGRMLRPSLAAIERTNFRRLFFETSSAPDQCFGGVLTRSWQIGIASASDFILGPAARAMFDVATVPSVPDWIITNPTFKPTTPLFGHSRARKASMTMTGSHLLEVFHQTSAMWPSPAPYAGIGLSSASRAKRARSVCFVSAPRWPGGIHMNRVSPAAGARHTNHA